MKIKINEIKLPSTKRPSEVGYWKLNEIPGNGEWLKQNHQFFNFWGKNNMRKLWKTRKVKMRKDKIKSMKSRTQN